MNNYAFCAMVRYLKILPKKRITQILKTTLDEIKFLESIIETGGANSYFSNEFRAAAAKEKFEKCNVSSACYAALFEKYDLSHEEINESLARLKNEG